MNDNRGLTKEVQAVYDEALKVLNERSFIGDIFIVPNSLTRVDGFYSGIKATYQRLIDMETSLPDFSETKDGMVQVWTVLPLPGNKDEYPEDITIETDEEYDYDHKSYTPEEKAKINFRTPVENFEDHRGSIMLDDGWKVIVRHSQGFLPVRCFTGLKEGDTVTIQYPISVSLWNRELHIHEDGLRATIPVTVRLAQTRYRYRNYGSFETLLAKLIEQAEARSNK